MKKEVFDKFLVENNDLINNISKEACDIHASVNQMYDDKPYSVHIIAVAVYAMKYGYYICNDEKEIIPLIFGAYFHDTIEDARLTYNDVKAIAAKYMDDEQVIVAANIVYACTNEKGKTRAERANEKYYREIRETPFAPLVKMCDRFANIKYSASHNSRMIGVYSKEWKHFLNDVVSKDVQDYRCYVSTAIIESIENILNGKDVEIG